MRFTINSKVKLLINLTAGAKSVPSGTVGVVIDLTTFNGEAWYKVQFAGFGNWMIDDANLAPA